MKILALVVLLAATAVLAQIKVTNIGDDFNLYSGDDGTELSSASKISTARQDLSVGQNVEANIGNCTEGHYYDRHNPEGHNHHEHHIHDGQLHHEHYIHDGQPHHEHYIHDGQSHHKHHIHEEYPHHEYHVDEDHPHYEHHKQESNVLNQNQQVGLNDFERESSAVEVRGELFGTLDFENIEKLTEDAASSANYSKSAVKINGTPSEFGYVKSTAAGNGMVETSEGSSSLSALENLEVKSSSFSSSFGSPVEINQGSSILTNIEKIEIATSSSIVELANNLPIDFNVNSNGNENNPIVGFF